ncbi:ribosomal L1 domain-containing protein 1-like [Physella acuta]|uniref:ribosomal L1 domain-containing protein 1-like n=1 Tax=Physella acuta TaxID=109671 RepID=UPI0027DB27A6|nr:ribosomal L1 domain-containing protein 1-like [Physella acuta]
MILNESKVSKAVDALLQLVKNSKKQDSLIEEIDVVQLQVCLKKIPPKEKSIKLKLPHSLAKPDLDVCLFVKDLDKEERDYEPTVQHFQDLFKKKGITTVTDIVPLKSLKTEYKPFEAKRNLSNAYDIFLADSRIVRLLPTYLGKHFYGKKKTPVQVNLQAKDLSKELKKALDNSICTISSKGSCSLAVVGNIQMSSNVITENVVAAVDQITNAVSGGADNVKLLSLKTKTSLSIPIYLNEGGPQAIVIDREEKNKEVVEAEEITTLVGAKVKVYPNGRIQIIKDGEPDKPPVKRQMRKRKRQSQRKIAKPKKIKI